MKEYTLRIRDVSTNMQKEKQKIQNFWSEKEASRIMWDIEDVLAEPITVSVEMLPTESPAKAMKKVQLIIQQTGGTDSSSKTVYGLTVAAINKLIKL